MLTQSELKELLTYDPETGLFRWNLREVRCKQDAAWNSAWAGQVAGTIKDGYISICIRYTLYRAHRIAVLYMIGRMPKNDVDHINRNRSDNRWANLREATRSQNLINGRHKSESRGVNLLPSGSWRSRAFIDGKVVHIGCFSTKAAAIAAYRRVTKGHYGEFHR